MGHAAVLVQLEPLTGSLNPYCKMEQTNPSASDATYVGLDISKDLLDYTVDEQRIAQVSNNAQGHHALTQALGKLRPAARVVCEATGGYERPVVAALLQAKIEVCLVNPGRVRAFAHAEGLLAKTDRLDARLLRRFGAKVQPRLHAPMDQAAVVLRELLDYRHHVSEQLVATTNRLDTAGPVLAKLLGSQIKFLQSKLKQVERLIDEHIKHDDNLRTKAQRLRALKGVGPVLAATLMAYLPELGQLNDKAISSLVGVAPYAHDSGQSHNKRHIRGGRANVRATLYMAAVAAIRCNDILGAFYRRLRDHGKPPKVALVAVMSKMLRVLNRLLADPSFELAH
jgi:transposase